MKPMVSLLSVSLAAAAAAAPGTFNDLGDYQKVADDYWNTSNRVEVAVDVSYSSAAETSSSILKAWDFSSIINIWSTPYAAFMLMVR